MSKKLNLLENKMQCIVVEYLYPGLQWHLWDPQRFVHWKNKISQFPFFVFLFGRLVLSYMLHISTGGFCRLIIKADLCFYLLCTHVWNLSALVHIWRKMLKKTLIWYFSAFFMNSRNAEWSLNNIKCRKYLRKNKYR